MTPELRRIGSRVVWWDTPDHVIRRLDHFPCRVMALGDLAGANDIETLYGAGRLRTALASAPPGVPDARSWHYRHHRLGFGKPGPLPARRFV